MNVARTAELMRLTLMGACLAWVGTARSASIDSLAVWSGGLTASFGDNALLKPGGTTFGQTFSLADDSACLTGLSFVVQGYAPNAAPEACTFDVFIMPWDGARPVGPVLYQSPALTMPLGFFPTLTFDLTLDNLPVGSDQSYVFFLTSNDHLDGIRSDAAVGTVSGSGYEGGTFVSQWPGYSVNDLLASDWFVDSSQDFAFRLEYTVAPEPAAPLLLIFGLLICGVSRLRRESRARSATPPDRGRRVETRGQRCPRWLLLL